MQSNIKNRTIYCRDNIDVMRGMDDDSIDMIYLDPPFNKNETFVVSERNKKKIEKIRDFFLYQQKKGLFPKVNFRRLFEESPSFDDIWRDNDIRKKEYPLINKFNHELINYLNSIRQSSAPGSFYYLIFMSIRVIEMKRILKDGGSIFLHCDNTMSHYIKIILDKVFGENYFQNEIVWSYRRWPAKQKRYQKMHDIIFWYTKNANEPKSWNQQYEELSESTKETWGTKQQIADFSEGHRKPSQTNMESPGAPMRDVWDIGIIAPIANERAGYPTQKPLALLKRIIEGVTKEGDTVLDPFCGCATTCLAADELDRKWIGIDINERAFYMIYYRAQNENKNNNIDLDTFRKELTMSLDDADMPVKTTTEEFDLIGDVSLTMSTYRSIKRVMNNKEKAEAKELLYKEQAGLCNGCDTFLREVDLTIDHIIPQNQGRDDSIENLQLLCYRCNNWKRTGTMIDLVKKLYSENVIPAGIYNKQMKEYNKARKVAEPEL